MLGSLLRRTGGASSAPLRTLRSSCTTTSLLGGRPLGLYYCPKSPPTLVPLFLGAGSPGKLARGLATDSTAPAASSSSSSTSSGSSSSTKASSSSGGGGSSSSDTTPSSEPSRKFEGASASDSFASTAHAGFERGSEGRFGYSRRLAANWDRIFGKKNGNVEQPPEPQTNGTAAQTNGTNLSSSATPNNTKQADLNQIFGKKAQDQQWAEDTKNLEAILKGSSGLPAHLKDSLLKLKPAEFEVLLNVLETARSSNGQRDAQKH